MVIRTAKKQKQNKTKQQQQQNTFLTRARADLVPVFPYSFLCYLLQKSLMMNFLLYVLLCGIAVYFYFFFYFDSQQMDKRGSF